jgi:peptide/nickel transport system substrate-binding protein
MNFKEESTMKQSKWALGASVAMALALLSTGVSMAAVRPVALPHNDTVVMALPPQTDINWYFPIVDIPSNSLYSGWSWNMEYHNLIQLRNTGAFDWKDSIASHVAVNSAGTVFTVSMNKKWKWSNGSPVTSQNVLTTWELIEDTSASNAPAPWPYTGAGTGDIPTGVKSVTTQGNYQFTVTMKKPVNKLWFIYNGLNDLEPLPSVWLKYPTNLVKEDNWLAKAATNPNLPEYKITDGPYQLTQAVNNQKWVYKANPNYSGHKPQVKEIIFLYESSNTSEYAALKTGQVQFGYLPATMWDTRSQLNGIDKLWLLYPLQYDDLLVNMNQSSTKVNTAPNGVAKLFNQLYIRQAIQMGIDQPAINKATMNGNGIDEYTAITAKPKTVFFPPNLKALYPFNPVKGKALLIKHGWKDVNGVMTRGKQQLSFTLDYASGDSSLTDQVTLIQEGLAQEGIKVKLSPATFNTLIAEKPDQWEMMEYGGITYGGSYPSGDGLFETPGVGLDSQGYSNPEMVKLIQNSLKPGTTKQSLQALYKYLAYVAKDLPMQFVPDAPVYEEQATDLHGIQSTFNPFTQYPDPQYWYYSK